MNLSAQGQDGGAGDRELNSKATALFVSNDIKYKKLTVTPGLRYENISLERIDNADASKSNKNDFRLRDKEKEQAKVTRRCGNGRRPIFAAAGKTAHRTEYFADSIVPSLARLHRSMRSTEKAPSVQLH